MSGEEKLVVVSAINIDSGGPLSVLRDCLAATGPFSRNYRFLVLVHDRGLFDGLPAHLEYREFPRSKRRWGYRLWYEFVHFRTLSRAWSPWLWFSLHDVTPRVQAEHRAVYCHNTSPFHRLRASDFWLEPTLVAFRLFYGRLYGVNIRRNDAVVVQQQWLRDEFRRRYGVQRVVVAHPVVADRAAPTSAPVKGEFFYPCLPRVFKNVELTCRAFARLEDTGARLVLTIAGDENRYARRLKRRFGGLSTVRFAGRMTREEVYATYDRACALVFPSLLESWGLPLSEFRSTGRPVFAADLPYAHEALAGHPHAAFFDPYDDAGLAERLRSFLEGEALPPPASGADPAPPFAADWAELWAMLLAGTAGSPATAAGEEPPW